jgi:hypothetical protein
MRVLIHSVSLHIHHERFSPPGKPYRRRRCRSAPGHIRVYINMVSRAAQHPILLSTTNNLGSCIPLEEDLQPIAQRRHWLFQIKMAPTNERTQYGGTGSSRPYRNANTNAGVSRHHPAASRGVPRVRDSHRRPVHAERARAPANAPTGPSLLSRMTYDRGREGFNRDVTTRHRPQYTRRLQDRIIRANHVTAGAGVSGGERTTNLQVERYSPEQAVPAVPMNDDIDIILDSDNEIDIDIASPKYDNPDFDTDHDFGSLFMDSQPTQPVTAPASPSPLPQPTHSAQPTHPIRMFNEPVAISPVNIEGEDEPARPKRPVNTYGGKDPIKRLVQNPKLQAILAGKPIPAERKKHRDERMDLRIGVSKVTK